MIHIVPRNPPPSCTATPSETTLPQSVTIRFAARSSRPQGESGVVLYDLGDGSEVLIDADGQRTPRLEVPCFIAAGRTPVDQELRLVAAEDHTPCGSLSIRIFVRRETEDQPDDQCLTLVEITCA